MSGKKLPPLLFYPMVLECYNRANVEFRFQSKYGQYSQIFLSCSICQNSVTVSHKRPQL